MTSPLFVLTLLPLVLGSPASEMPIRTQAGQFTVTLDSGWKLGPVRGSVLGFAKAELHMNGNVRFTTVNVGLTTASNAKKSLGTVPEANAELMERNLSSTAGKIQVYERFVPPAKTSNGGSLGEYDAIYVFPLKGRESLTFRWNLPFRSFPGDFSTLEEAKAETAEFRQKVDAMMATLRKAGAVFAEKPTPFTESKQTLGQLKCKVALPKGKKLTDVKTVLINIPPSGSAHLFAPSACAKRGWASIALTGLNTSEPLKLQDIVKKVVASIDKQAGHSKTRLIFTGFSAGGFSAANCAKTFEARCDGLVTIGSFTAAQLLPSNKKLPIVFLLGSKDFNRNEALKALQTYSPGWNIQMITFNGGHTWGNTEDHTTALKLIQPD